MTCIKVTVASIVVFLAVLSTIEGMSLRSLGGELRCRCIQTESKRIGRFIDKVQITLPNSHCEDTEIIATLKKTGQQVCLNPQAPWVKDVIKKILEPRGARGTNDVPL